MTYDPLNINQLNRTEPTYLAAYGLTEAPFSLQQNDRFYYLNPALKEQLALLQHYTQYGNLLLLITGERGIGKSSLKQRFINTAQEEWRVCEIQAHTMMDASVLLRQIAQGFGITEPPFDASSLYEVLSEQLEYLHQQSYEPILIIDDAHELPQDALQSLLYLAEHHSDHDSALRIILFCEPQIETMLEDPAIHSLKERITHSIDIAKLDEAETAEYLRHRLAVAGLDGTSPFTPKLINKIYKASGGIPYKINEYAHQNLLDDREPVVDDEQEHDDALIHSESQFTLRNMILGGIALTVVIAVLLFQDDINRVFEEPGPVKTIATETKAIPPATEITTPQAAVSPPAAKQKTIEFSLNSPDAAQQAENSKPVETIKPVTENHQEPAKESPAPAAATLKLDSINPDPVPPSQQRQIIAI
ncbi:MAG: AAA family ATPase, partial [Gammaproteobacteria bacterium]|nr:AAA family ATPase [Gammaproteobacteria bacterium]